ncbi:hypothetical protein [Dankookia sp. P2]|uniref:hypothetical protein n=1 Tax=Dankookia sp. P2 TaxID=3423955 RepID=UPI003D666DCF
MSHHLLALSVAGCSIAPPPPEPDPAQGGYRQEGKLVLPDPAQLAACVSQEVPGTVVVLRQAGAAVRPVAGSVLPGHTPDFALVVDQPPRSPLVWRVLVAESGPAAEPIARALDRALGDCAARLGRTP